jgi:hypothetical protein
MMTASEKAIDLKIKLTEARSYERTQGKPCYVVWSVPMECYLTWATMPMAGEWYTSDGIRHG